MSLKLALKDDDRETLLVRYRAMAEEGSDIIVLHEGGKIVFTTKALDRLLKRTGEEFQGGGYLNLVHPDDMAEALTLRGTPPPGEVWTATYRVRHGDGHYIWFETRTNQAIALRLTAHAPRRSYATITWSKRSKMCSSSRYCGQEIVSFHNSRIGDAAATEMFSRGEHNSGHSCRKRFGEGVVSIGFGMITAL